MFRSSSILFSHHACAHLLLQVGSRDVDQHLEFLQVRRSTFLGAFEGRGLSALIRSLVGVLDQTECLPLHLFDQIMHPVLLKDLKRNVLISVDQASSKRSTLDGVSPTKKRRISSAPSSSNCLTSPDYHRWSSEVKHCWKMIPRGLIAPPLQSSNYHERLTGGVSGLVDRRVLLLLGRWFPHFQPGCCAGSVASEQIRNGYPIALHQIPDGCSQAPVLPTNRCNYTVSMIYSLERCLPEVRMTKPWYGYIDYHTDVLYATVLSCLLTHSDLCYWSRIDIPKASRIVESDLKDTRKSVMQSS